MHGLARVALSLLLLPLACNDGETSTETTGATATTGGSTTSGAATDAGTTAEPATSDAPTTSSPTTSGSTSTAATDAVTTTEPAGSSSTSGPPPVGCEGDAPRVRLATNMGDMVVQLDAVNAPITVANFIQYVEADFFAGTIFHRVIDGFVLQGGGFTADLQMKPTEPPIPLEIGPGLLHVDGAIAMARTMDPNSATSQFYICDGPQPGLDGNYAVFGALIEGFDVRDAISAVATDANDTPIEDVIILSATCE